MCYTTISGGPKLLHTRDLSSTHSIFQSLFLIQLPTHIPSWGLQLFPSKREKKALKKRWATTHAYGVACCMHTAYWPHPTTTWCQVFSKASLNITLWWFFFCIQKYTFLNEPLSPAWFLATGNTEPWLKKLRTTNKLYQMKIDWYGFISFFQFRSDCLVFHYNWID